MINDHSEFVLEVTAHDRNSIQDDLDGAVALALKRALELHHGVLVTQRGPRQD